MQIKKLTTLMLGLCVGAMAHAEDPITVTKDKDYNLDADLSYLLNSTETGGTSETKSSFAGNFDYKRMFGAWGGEFKASAVSSTDSSSTDNVEQYLAFAKAMHSEGSFYEFGKLQWEKDLTSAYDSQTSLTGGLGTELYHDNLQLLTGELGAGVRYDVDRAPPQDTKTEAVGTVAAHYERQLLPTTKFIQDLGFDYAASSNTIRSHSAVSVAMSDKLSGLVSFDYKKINSDLGGSRTTLTSVGLKYSY